MDKIYESANNFNKLLETEYIFTIVEKRKQKTIVLDFMKSDFRHATGLHYIDDISIENNPAKLVDSILNGNLTDEKLAKSSKYIKSRPEGGTIKKRVSEFTYLEDYLDNKNSIIKIFTVQNFKSEIDADYFIEATNAKRCSTVYIFIRKRRENDNYVIVSFFPKSTATYQGGKVYWMLKEKITANSSVILYQNPNYILNDSKNKKEQED